MEEILCTVLPSVLGTFLFSTLRSSCLRDFKKFPKTEEVSFAASLSFLSISCLGEYNSASDLERERTAVLDIKGTKGSSSSLELGGVAVT